MTAVAALLSVTLLVLRPATAGAVNAPIVVNSDADDPAANPAVSCATSNGDCTLRSAIERAESLGGDDIITFNIPSNAPNTRGDGVRVILVGGSVGAAAQDLPLIQSPDRLTIDGRSQGTGPNNSPLILILPDPNAVSPPPALAGLDVDGGVATISGLAIGGFRAGILIDNTNGTVVKGSFIGVDPDGLTPIPNVVGIDIENSLNTDIGGSTAINRNVVSNNSTDGISLDSCGCSPLTSTIRGNYVGLDPTGASPMGNGGNGIHILNSQGIVVGGANPGEGNVISGNGLDGVTIEGADTQDVRVFANRIGTDATGAFNLGNGQNGISVVPEMPGDPGPIGTIIGFGSAGSGPGNQISGSFQYGIYVVNTEDTLIRGNLIGLAANGSTPIGNLIGIYVDSAFNTDIGGAAAADRNVISGNGQDGIYLQGVCGCSGDDTDVRGNYIGVNAAGTSAVPNGANGVHIFGDETVFITTIGIVVGGSDPGEGNVISGNQLDGVRLEGDRVGFIDVYGNRIGTNAAGTAAVANGQDGISIVPIDPLDTSSMAAVDTTIGNLQAGSGNLISGNTRHGIRTLRALPAGSDTTIGRNLIGVAANGNTPLGNGGNGILLEDSVELDVFENVIANNGLAGIVTTPFMTTDFENRLTLNQIYANQGLGIDVSATVDVNGVGLGKTPNTPLGEFNFPVLTSATTSAAGTVIGGTLNGPPVNSFHIELFVSPSCDPSGNGEGRAVLGEFETQTDGSGNAVFAVTAQALPPGQVITATSTNPDDQTSEFSACQPVTTAAILVTPTSGLVTTEGGGTATFTVALSTLPVADVTIGLSSSRPTEATVSPSSLTFTSANGTTPQTVTVTGARDSLADGNQEFTIITAPAVSADPGYSGMDAANVTGSNQDVPTFIQVVAPPGGLVTTEAGGTATFTVVLSSLPTADVTIGLSSSKPTEATVSPSSLTFTPANGTTPRTVTVTGVPDSVADGNQAFTIVTAPAVSADPAYNGMDAADVTGLNRDAPTLPTLSIQPTAQVVEGTGGAGTTPMPFTVTLSPASTQSVTVAWQVIDGTAHASSDYDAYDRLGVLSFAPGETSKQIVIHITADGVPESNETFTLKLSNATNAVLSAADTAVGTIVDDDTPTSPCSPRPNITMTTTRTGTDQIVVTVKAGSGTLTKISFGSQAKPLQNALVETINPSGIIQSVGTFTPPAGVTQQSFIVRRLAPNQPFMVTLTIEDGCGPWTTFVGAGAAAF